MHFYSSCQGHTFASLKKVVGAISVGLKCGTRYSCYSHLQRDSLIVSIMEDILSQSMMFVTVWEGVQIFTPIQFNISFRSYFTKLQQENKERSSHAHTTRETEKQRWAAYERECRRLISPSS
jgi:hypothetical protein